jgi:hypothetical protein
VRRGPGYNLRWELHAVSDPAQLPRAPLENLGVTIILSIPDPEIDTTQPGPAEVYAALWSGALLVASGELSDPFPPAIEELVRTYIERYAPEAKA